MVDRDENGDYPDSSQYLPPDPGNLGPPVSGAGVGATGGNAYGAPSSPSAAQPSVTNRARGVLAAAGEAFGGLKPNNIRGAFAVSGQAGKKTGIVVLALGAVGLALSAVGNLRRKDEQGQPASKEDGGKRAFGAFTAKVLAGTALLAGAGVVANRVR